MPGKFHRRAWWDIQSMWSQRVRHDGVCMHVCMHWFLIFLTFHLIRAAGFPRIFREKEFRKVSSAGIPDWLPRHPGVSQRTGYSLRTMLGGSHTLQPPSSREEPQASRGPRDDNFQESCLWCLHETKWKECWSWTTKLLCSFISIIQALLNSSCYWGTFDCQ